MFSIASFAADSPPTPLRPTFQFNVKPRTPNSDVYPPFDITHDVLDVVLRSSDEVYFHTLKVFLSVASPLFRDMFSLPQPPLAIIAQTASGVTPLDDIRDGRPVIGITESSLVLQTLLRFCYPKWTPEAEFFNLGDVQEVLEAAQKYQMSEILAALGNILVTPRFLNADPFRVFAIACRYKLKTQAAVAARDLLRVPLSSRATCLELDHISGGVLQRLLDYHFKCSRAAQNVVMPKNSIFPWIVRDDYQWFQHRKCASCSLTTMSGPITISKNRPQSAAGYWTTYMFDIANAMFETPCVASVMKDDLFDKALKLADLCPHCSPGNDKQKIRDDLQAFRQLLAKEVNKALSHITFILEL